MLPAGRFGVLNQNFFSGSAQNTLIVLTMAVDCKSCKQLNWLNLAGNAKTNRMESIKPSLLC